jgi:hypothetical protein
MIFPLLSTFPSSLAAFFLAYSDINIGFPEYFILKKNLPVLEFLSGIT